MEDINKFDTINYLAAGTLRQQQAYNVLMAYSVMEILLPFSAVLVGTIPININIESSDLDVLCEYQNKEAFVNYLHEHFSSFAQFKLTEAIINGQDSVLVNFMAGDFEIEIFGQPVPVKQQYGYRHMIIEHELLQLKGEGFRQEIISLKRKGLKTEPAFAKALGLSGDPYEKLLGLDVTQF